MECLHDETDDINTQQLFRIHRKRFLLNAMFVVCALLLLLLFLYNDDGTKKVVI